MLTTDGQVEVSRPIAQEAPCALVILSPTLAGGHVVLDVEGLTRWLEANLPAVQLRMAATANEWSDLVELIASTGAERLVLGLAAGERVGAQAQAEARRAGIDALGIQRVDLGSHALPFGPHATERVKLLLAAALAKARAFSGSGPRHLKLSLSVASSRRSLLTLALHEYRAVPVVLPGRCAAEWGCRACAEVCPAEALGFEDSLPELDKALCESCGLCVGACPADAINFPGHSPFELDAQIRALLDRSLTQLTPRGLLFLCDAGERLLAERVAGGSRYPAGWLPVLVPCVGGLSPSLFLEGLALGADAVGVISCGGHCPFQQDERVAARVGFCREFLGAIGGNPDQVTACSLTGDQAAWTLTERITQRPPARGWNNDRSAAGAILDLARAYGTQADLTLDHPESPFGLVELDPTGCTGCEACALACPTGALASERDEDAIRITFDPAACTACGLCVPRCPEKGRDVLRLRRGLDLGRLAAGRVALYADRPLRCEACGGPVAPAGMMARIAHLLGDAYEALEPSISRYCLECRGRPR